MLVELLRRYSNRRDLVDPLVDVLRRIEQNDQEDEPGLDESAQTPRDDRPTYAGQLTPEKIQKLITAYLDGVTAVELAAREGVSLSTIRRLLRKHGGRLKDAPS